MTVDCGRYPTKQIEARQGFPTKKKKIHQNPEAVRISAVCEAASNTDCRGGDLCTAGTGIIKRPLAEWVLKPRFSRPDSQAFPPGSQPLPAGWGEQVASGAIPGKSPPGPALCHVKFVCSLGQGKPAHAGTRTGWGRSQRDQVWPWTPPRGRGQRANRRA